MTDPKNIKLLILDVDGTLTDTGIYILEDGSQFRKFNARDGLGIKQAMKRGIEVGIISHSHVREVVESRAQMLGLHYCYVGNDSKVSIYNQWIRKMKLKKEEVAYIDDDINDLDIMEAVGLTACPADSVPAILNTVDIVLSKKGGDGCVREFIDEYLLK